MRNKQKKVQLRDVHDVLDILGGRWRGAILASLCDRDQRFNELRRDLGSITARTLSKELRFLRQHRLIWHEVHEAVGTYGLTQHGQSLEPLIAAIVAWGQRHRRVVLDARDG